MTEQPPPTEVAQPYSRESELSPARSPLLAAVGALVVLLVLAAFVFRGRVPTTSYYIGLSMLLFVVGGIGVLIRRNALVLFMCIELMLNAVNIAFVAFGRLHGAVDAHVVVLFVMIVAAAEVAIGLAIIVSIFRRKHTANVDELNLLKW